MNVSSWNNIVSYFIFLEIRPLPLPSPTSPQTSPRGEGVREGNRAEG
jgi:hypothetical protein